MAISPKSVSIIFLVTLLIMQIHARESQFFSKVTSTQTTTTPTTTTTIGNNKNETESTTFPSKEQESLTKQEKEPTFMPETQNDNYGLYGQEQGTNQFSTTTTTKHSSSSNTKTQTEETYNNNYPNSNTKYNNNKNYYYYSNNNRYNNNGYEEQLQEEDFGHETSLQESGYTTKSINPNQHYYNYNNNVEKQGMSDTRYLENGRYFYDVQNKKNYYPTTQYQNTKASHSNRDYYYYNNNNNNEQFSEYSNPNGNYQSQKEEFQEGEEEQYSP